MTIVTKHKIPANGRKLNVCAYARVSSDKDLAEMSLKTQIQFYTTEIMKNPGWEYCGVYADDGISGTSTETRDGFNRMVDKALHGLIDIILVKSISRFGRNILDVMTAINKLREMGVEVYFEKENISTLDPSSTIALNLYAKLAEQEAINVSENVKWSMERRMKEGRYRIPVEEMLGYAYDEEGNVIIIEEEAKIVREVFELYTKRLSASFIARRMMEKGYKTGTGRSDWTEKSVRTMIINEKYAGDCLLHKQFSPKISARSQVVNRGEKNAYYIKDGHPAIVSREIWEKACALREERRTKMGKALGQEKRPPSQYAGFGICPYCGKNYYIKRLSNAKSGIKKCLACGSNKGLLTCKDSESVFLDDLNAILIKQLQLIRTQPIQFKNELKEAFKFDESATKCELNTLNERIDYLREKLNSLENSNSESSLSLKDEIHKELEKYLLEKELIENKLLTGMNAETEIDNIFKSLDLVDSNNITNTFRYLFKHMIVIDRLHLVFIIGRECIKGIDLKNLKTCLNGTYEIKVRAQLYKANFGIYINA